MADKGKFGLRFLAMTVMAAAAFGFSSLVQGAEFPAKAITILCGSTAGSPVDIMARELAKQMEKNLRKAVVVQNRPGGSQAEELSFLLGQPADGHTLATVTTSTAGALAGHLPCNMASSTARGADSCRELPPVRMRGVARAAAPNFTSASRTASSVRGPSSSRRQSATSRPTSCR